MAVAMRGLKVKPPHEQLTGVASPDGLEQIKFPNRDAEFIRYGFILSQLDGEGMRQIQLQQQERKQRNIFKKKHLLKQASDTTGVNISDLRHSSNAETQTNRINNMLRPTNFRDVFVQQGTTPSRPSQFTDESSETFHQGSKPTQFKDANL